MRIGLCLSGGGTRGIFHIGVLQALEEYDIKPDIVAGSSYRYKFEYWIIRSVRIR